MNQYRSHQKALRFIASILLIQRRERCPSREEKSAFTQWFSPIYARSLKDQARKSKYPRTQILEPRTQSKLICYSSTTFLPTRSNNLIVGHFTKLYSFLRHPIQVVIATYIASSSDHYRSARRPIQVGAMTNSRSDSVQQLFGVRTNNGLTPEPIVL